MELLHAIEGIRSPFLDNLFGVITMLGEQTMLIVVFCFIYWCINKRMAYVMGVVFFLSSLAVQGMKICFRIERPWVVDPTFRPVPSALEHATGSAFPSGPTQNAAALLGTLGALLRPVYLKVILFTLPVLVAFSRMYLGVHTLPDVVASLIITFLLILLAAKLITEEPVCRKRELLISSFILLCSAAVLIIVTVLNFREVTEAAQLSDGVKAAGAAIGFGIGMYIERIYIRFSVKSKNVGIHLLKFVLGVAGTLALQEGLKLIGSGFIIDAVRYFLMISWVTVFFPLIIKRFFSVPESATATGNN
jgi:undecaprenyl-diphosphatase